MMRCAFFDGGTLISALLARTALVAFITISKAASSSGKLSS